MLVRIFSNLTSIQLHPSSSASKSKTRVSVAIFVQCQVIAVRILEQECFLHMFPRVRSPARAIRRAKPSGR